MRRQHTQRRGQDVAPLLRCLLLALLACGLASCDTPDSPGVLPVLHAPGLALVPGLDQVRGDDPADVIVGLAAFQSQSANATAGAGRATDGVLVQTSTHQVYDIGLDGAKPRHLQLQSECDPYGLSVTRDGQQAVCSTGTGTHLVRAFCSFHPIAQHDEGRLLVPQASSQASPPANRMYPTWAPDGVHLAMIEVSATVCSIAIVTVDAASATFQPSAFLTFSEDDQGRCLLNDLAWSPDGHWLAVARSTAASAGLNPLYALSLSAWSLFGHEASPVTIAIPSTAMVRVAPSVDSPAWLPGVSPTITYLASANEVDRVDVTTGTFARVLTITLPASPNNVLCGLGWTPDGSRMVVGDCGPSNEVTIGPPAQLYVYTPIQLQLRQHDGRQRWRGAAHRRELQWWHGRERAGARPVQLHLRCARAADELGRDAGREHRDHRYSYADTGASNSVTYSDGEVASHSPRSQVGPAVARQGNWI